MRLMGGIRLLTVGLAVTSLAVLGAACGSDDDPDSGTDTGAPATTDDLEGQSWQLQSFSTDAGDDLVAASTETRTPRR